MTEENRCIEVVNLPLSKDDKSRLRVELVPMPGGDDPWRSSEDYRREQRRDTWRFWFTIASLVVAIASMLATASVAISTIRSLS